MENCKKKKNSIEFIGYLLTILLYSFTASKKNKKKNSKLYKDKFYGIIVIKNLT